MSKHQTPEEKFDAAMRDPRLVDEAAGFISDQDAATLAAMVAATYHDCIRRDRNYPDNDALATIGLAYWTAITRAQLRIARGEF